MGNVFNDIFGGSSNKSSSQSNSNSYNQAYNYLNGALAPQVSNATTANNAETALLTGGPGADQAYQNFLGSTGYQQTLNEGLKAINNNAATTGTFNSGATMKALDNYATNQANTTYQNYLGDLNQVAQTGNSAAGTIAGAGQVSNSSSTSTGKGSSTGGIIPGLFG